MQSLVANIHKANGEWNRKSREFTITVARCNMNPNTANTPLLKELTSWTQKGDALDHGLASLESKHAIGVYVDITEQVEAKKAITQLTKIAKDATKVKLLMRGVLYCVLALEGLLIS